MSEVQSIKEDFLTCTICTNIYIDPCTLNCQHSFCRKCVTEYIKIRSDAVQSATIPCAFCRQVTPVPNPTRPVDDWAKQMKPSLMLQGLMDKLQTGHNHREGQDICFLCNEVGETTPSSSWCSDCEVTLCSRCTKMHLKAPSSSDHDITDLSGGVKVKQKRKVKCREHTGEQIKFICKDCNKAVCQTCCVIQHRACNHVVTIESVVPEMKSALTEMRCSLGQRMKENIAAVREEKSRIERLKSKETKTEEDVNLTIEGAITLLRTKQSDLLKEIRDVSGKEIAEHQANVKSGLITTQVYQQHCEFIDQALQSDSEIEMYDMYQVCLSGAVESAGDTDLETKSTLDMKFTPNMEPLQKAITRVGNVDVTFQTDKTSVTPRRNRQSPTTPNALILLDSINIKHKDDKYNPDPIDVTVLNLEGVTCTTVVVADYANSSLKSVYPKSGERKISLLKLSSKPRRLVNMINNRIAVTMGNNSIVIAEVRPELVLIKTLKTKKQYWGLALLADSTLVAGSPSPSVDVLDLRGNVVRSFTPQNTGLNLLKSPNYLGATHEGNILVSDVRSESVYCLTSEGNIVFTFTPTRNQSLTEPRGITVTKTGEILFTDSGSKKIIQLKSDGTFFRDIAAFFKDAGSPWGLDVDEANKLFVCKRGESGCVKVYTIN